MIEVIEQSDTLLGYFSVLSPTLVNAGVKSFKQIAPVIDCSLLHVIAACGSKIFIVHRTWL